MCGVCIIIFILDRNVQIGILYIGTPSVVLCAEGVGNYYFLDDVLI